MQEKALHEVHAQPLHRLVLLRSLNAFGNHLRALIVRESHHRLDEVLLDEVRVDAVDERDVELDEVGLEVRDGTETGIAAPGVVHREAVPTLAERLETLTELRIILDGCPLRNLDDHATRIRHLTIELTELRVDEIMRIDVEEQQLAVREVMLHGFDRLAATQPTELPQ